MSDDKKDFHKRSGFDRRGLVDRRVLNLGFAGTGKKRIDRRIADRRKDAERRADWKRVSKWSSEEDGDE